MKRGKRKPLVLYYLVLSYLIIAVTSVNSFAKVPSSHQAREEVLAEWAAFKQRFGRKWQIQWDSSNLIPCSIMGKGERIRGKHSEAKENAREFIQENRKLLGIDLDNLQFEQVDKSEPFKHVTFRQHFCAIPIVGNRVTVHLIENNVDHGDIIGYSASYDPKALVSDHHPLYSATDSIARAHLPRVRIRDYPLIPRPGW